jgi:hypothetical protein
LSYDRFLALGRTAFEGAMAGIDLQLALADLGLAIGSRRSDSTAGALPSNPLTGWHRNSIGRSVRSTRLPSLTVAMTLTVDSLRLTAAR